MQFRLRTLLILLAVVPPVLALWHNFRQHSTSHHMGTAFAQMPDDDSQLKQWLSSQPNVKNVHVRRERDRHNPERQTIGIYFQTTSLSPAGTPPTFDLNTVLGRLGYSGPERLELDSW